MSAIPLPTLLGDLGPLWLVSPVKPILALLPFLPWAWAISTHLKMPIDCCSVATSGTPST